jgi:quinol monooxygenase YgiN
MIHVIATIDLVAGKRAAFLVEFHKLVPLVLDEQGCIEYGPTVDLATGIAAQIPLREDVVTIVEKWESLEALHVHLQAPHMGPYRARVKDLVKGVQLQVLQQAPV